MSQQTYLIRFKDVSDAYASQYAEELKNDLLDVSPDVQVERRSESLRTQDLGTVLGLVFSGVSVVTGVVQVIMVWQQAHNNTKIEIERPDGTKLILGDLNKREERRVLEEFLKEQ